MAAVVFSLVLTVGVIAALGFSPSRHIILKLALLYGLFALVHGTPAVLALTVILKRQPRFLLAGVVALIITIWGFEISTGIGLVGLWLMIAGIPAGFVLLLNTRRLRAIGLIVLAQMLLGFDGFSVGVAYATFYVLSAIGPLQFVHESLASLPFFDALERYFIWVWNLPWDQQWDEISTLIAAPSTSCWVSCVAASM